MSLPCRLYTSIFVFWGRFSRVMVLPVKIGTGLSEEDDWVVLELLGVLELLLGIELELLPPVRAVRIRSLPLATVVKPPGISAS